MRSTAQMIAQSNLDQLKQAQTGVQDPVAAPTKMDFGQASNPIGLISSGFNTMGQAMNAPSEQRARQEGMDRSAALQEQQTQYKHDQDIQRQANADRTFNSSQEALKLARTEKIGKQTADNLMNDSVASWDAMMSSGKMTYDELFKKKDELLQNMKNLNNKDDDVTNNVKLDTFKNMLATSLDQKFKLNTKNQERLSEFSLEQQELKAGFEREAIKLRDVNMHIMDPDISALTQLKIDGKIESGVDYALKGITYPDPKDRKEAELSAKEVVLKMEKEIPGFASSPYRNQIVASALGKAYTNDEWYRDNNDFTTNDTLALEIENIYKRLQNDQKFIKHNRTVMGKYQKSIDKFNSDYTKNLKKKSDTLLGIQNLTP